MTGTTDSKIEESPAKKARVEASSKEDSVQAFIDACNEQYDVLHRAFEDQFWGTKMALSGDFSGERQAETKNRMEAWLKGDEKRLERTEALLAAGGLTPEQEKTLRIFQRTFKCYTMPPAAQAQREAITTSETALEGARNTMRLGYTIGGTFTEASSVKLRNTMRTSSEEASRKACYEGLVSIGPFICQNGFPGIVKARNSLAKSLGYEDFYDMKCTQAEGFSKRRLFEMLDVLEARTRPIMERARARLSEEKGPSALEPWNTGYVMSGDVTKKMDPYFPFSQAVEMWGRSFSRLGIDYKGATMNLDLLDRKHKYSNGFCHWPQCAWVKSDGSWQPSVTNFTSLADPEAVGSGHTALATLMHEAGHAAHFANIRQHSPLFSQERAPTSVAYAENQSMFLDSLVEDARWRGRYARDREGRPIPFELHEEELRVQHPYAVFRLRGMLAVPYFERRLYELPEAEVTAEKIQALAMEVERDIQGGPSGRPLLSVPHIMSDESSCYYHGYVLAEMSVHQTRAHFLQTYGVIVDNPRVGADLTAKYWVHGNSENFLDLVEGLTGKPLSGDAWVAVLDRDIEDLVAAEKSDYAVAVAQSHPREDSPEVELGMQMRIIDGDATLADSAAGGFVAACRSFAAELDKRTKTAAA